MKITLPFGKTGFCIALWIELGLDAIAKVADRPLVRFAVSLLRVASQFHFSSNHTTAKSLEMQIALPSRINCSDSILAVT